MHTTSPRRRHLVLLLAAVVTLAACGGDDGGRDATTDSEPSAADAFPVTIEHRYGDTVIEEQPTRIVTVGLTEQDALLALGIVPVATTEWFGERPGAVWEWAQDELEALGAEPPAVLGDATAVNVESVAAQRPDLILAIYSGLTEEEYAQLSQIAPVVAPPADTVDYGVSWDDATRTVGRAVGKAGEAEDLIDDVEEQVAAARAAHPEFTGASAVIATPYEGIFVYGRDDTRVQFLTSLGFEMPAEFDEVLTDAFGSSLSQERADLLDVDLIVWLDPEDGDGPLGGPLYSTFAVHTEGREVFLDSFDDPLGGATSFVTPLSIPFLLEGLVPKLAAAADGDPATTVPA
jgi:iron complex transport system substrate-binding protein